MMRRISQKTKTATFLRALSILVWLLISTTAYALTEKETETIDPCYFETDVPSLIQIHSPQDVVRVREAFVHYIWGPDGLPLSKLPTSVSENIEDERYAELYEKNLKQIDKLTIGMDNGLIAVAYHFIPKESNRQLIVYQQGHNGDFIVGINTISACVEKGYAVMAFSMPLMGTNNQPTVYLERFGRFKLTKHDHLKLLDYPMKYFLEPVAVGLNYAAKYKYTRTHMTGISGGGWTTTLYTAIDTRISHSYPVAGTLPLYLRSNCNRDWGDYEQTEPQLYRIANYPELYVMGAHGKGRKQIQILNKYDSCCFAGIRYRTYEQTVQETVTKLGKGGFRVVLDDTHKEHKISELALDTMFSDLEGKSKPSCGTK